ncbi:MAG: PAS domain S-box protein, partial [Gemmatimonadota bacterium]|nr:PAS domain S-box protein [Gemmatimonadota bacterium]
MTATSEPTGDLERINRFAIALLEAADLEALLWSIADNVGEILGFDDCVVYLRQGDDLVQMAAYGVKSSADREIFHRISIPLGRGIVGTVAQTGIAEIVPDTRKDPRYIFDEFAGLSELTVPVVYEGTTIAVLDSEASETHGFTEDQLALLQSVANIAASRIASALAERHLREAQEELRRTNERLEERVTRRTEELVRQRERLRVILRSVGDGVVATDGEGRVAFMSRTAETLTGWTEIEAAGRCLNEVLRLRPEDDEVWVSFRDRLHGSGVSEGRTEWILRARDGSESLVSEGIAEMSGEDREGWVIVIRDISSQRRTEAELRRAQQLESLGLLAGGIAHDFNNFLTSILGNLEILEFSRVLGGHPDLRNLVERTRTVAMQATGLPKQLISLARGGTPVVTRGIDLGKLITNTVEFSLAGSPVRGEITIAG